MAITGGFGTTMDFERGTSRQWVMGGDGVKRWADTKEPVEQPCRACGADGFRLTDGLCDGCREQERKMEYSDACIELAKLIQAGHYDYPEEAGLAIQVLSRSIDDGDQPAMALALAKHLEVDGASV